MRLNVLKRGIKRNLHTHTPEAQKQKQVEAFCILRNGRLCAENI